MKKKAKKSKSPAQKKARRFDPSPISEVIVEKPEDSSNKKQPDTQSIKPVKEF